MRLSNLRALRFTIALHLVCVATAWAQWQSNTGPAGAALGVVVGGDVERYVRALTLAGFVKPVPWGVRPLGPQDLMHLLRDSTRGLHPWRSGLRAASTARASLGGLAFTSVNSGFPWGANDGPMWQGRGANVAIGGASTLRAGPLTLVAAPVAFAAQNAGFSIAAQPYERISPFADPQFAPVVDLPQRMGARSYARMDAGESTISLRAGSAVLGVSTASLGWGTGEAFPAIFGANGGGFAHAFIGTTGSGARVPYLGVFAARYVLGVIEQSRWSPVQGSETYVSPLESGTRRIGTGITVSVMPSALPNLELGVSRFFHSPYLNGPQRWDAWSKPFEGLFKKSLPVTSGGGGSPFGDADNQIAAFFARWVFPRRGVEATFELLREDHNWDSRDLAQEPENNSAIHASFRAITSKRPDALALLTLEYFDGDVRPIAQQREQEGMYIHTGMRQGHTVRGQLLGAPIGVGAIAGQRIAWERFSADGSFRLTLQRWRSRSRKRSDIQGLYPTVAFTVPESHDWVIDGGVSASRFRRTRAITIEAGVAWAGLWQLADRRTNLYARSSWSIF